MRADGRRGRPLASSRSAIEDAAGELFLENTYAGTTVEQIANRAGVSRASFFNYFRSKSDLLWGDVDALIDGLAAALDDVSVDLAPMSGVRNALLTAAGEVPPGRIPLAATQWELMGARDELLASGLARYDRLASVVHRFLQGHCADRDPVVVRAAALATVGAVVAAASAWASGGVSRGDLAPLLDAAVSPVYDGFGPRLG